MTRGALGAAVRKSWLMASEEYRGHRSEECHTVPSGELLGLLHSVARVLGGGSHMKSITHSHLESS